MLDLKLFPCERRNGFFVIVETLEDKQEITNLSRDLGEYPLTWGWFSVLT